VTGVQTCALPISQPTTTSLAPAYPNPFNPRTTIRYSVADEGHVRLVVVDILGREVAVLTDGHQKTGQHEVVFDASHMPSGLYFYRLETAERNLTETMPLAK